MDVDTRHLRAFLAVVDAGSFTDAAAVLRTSQASVSRSVQRLEDAVGHRLLARTTRHVATTASGDRLVPYVRRVLAALDGLASAASGGGGDLRLGYAWAALGERTVGVQRRWAAQTGGDLVLVHADTASAGLLEGRCDLAVVRRRLDDPRLAGALIAHERRYAALAADHALAAAESLRLADFVGLVVAVDDVTGTTTEDLWPGSERPAGFRATHGVEDWLSLIAAGRTVGVSSEATRAQHSRSGVVYRPLADADPIPVWLIWWRDDPPAGLDALLDLVTHASGRA